MKSNQARSEVDALKARIADLEKKVSSQNDDDPFRAFVDSALNGVILSDGEGAIQMSNQPAQRMFGYSRDEFNELKIENLLPERFRQKHTEYRENFSHHPEVRAMGIGRDLYAMRKDQSEFPVEIGLTPIRYEDQTMTLSVIVDITERTKMNETLLLQSKILKTVNDAVFYLDEEGKILDWNEGAERIFHIPHEQAIHQSFFSFIDSDTSKAFEKKLIPKIKKKGNAEEVIFCKLKSNRELSLLAKGTLLRQNRKEGYVICASDITKQKRLEAKIVSISENEQRRIGRDLHDDLCSQLSGIACITAAMEAQYNRHRKEDVAMISRISEMVSDAVTKARQIAKGLVPTALETQGLDGALKELVQRNCELFGVNCRIIKCEHEAVVDLPATTSIQIYRIAQEAITNAVKHSEAEHIELSLTESQDNRVILRVEDDGKGMPGDLVAAGLGLLTMRQRAEIIGAEFDVHASPDEGTSIVCTVSKHKTIHE